MIAGQNIIYCPNTTVQSGGYMHGKISPGGPFCDARSLPAVLKEEKELPQPVDSEKLTVRIYPNPTLGRFNLVLSEEPEKAPVVVKIFNMMGRQIEESTIHSGRLHEFSLISQCPGVYMIKVMLNNEMINCKVIKQ